MNPFANPSTNPLLMPPEALTVALEWRHAVKRFDEGRKIGEEDWVRLKQSLRLAPSSFGLQPWHFIVVQNKALRAELSKATWDQPQVLECSHYVVLTSLKTVDLARIDHYVGRAADQWDTSIESLAPYREVMVNSLVKGPRSVGIAEWARRQVYIAMGFLLLGAAELGLDACPMEGLDHKAYDGILGLETGPWSTVATVALGYRAMSDTYQMRQKVRFPESEVFETR
jgi:nitroreductase